MMAEAIEQWSARAKHQRHGMNRLVMADGLIALNVGQWDMKLMSAKQHYSDLNLDSRAGERGPGGNPTQAQRVACAMQVPRRSDEKEAGSGMETLELKSGEKINVLNGACMAEINDNLPVLSGKVGGKTVEVLRDTGCSGVIITRELVNETDFTGEMGHIMTMYRTIKRAPMAKVEVDTPFYVGTVEALCLQDPLFDLIIGNVPGARRSDDPNPEWGVVTAVTTRAQVRNGKDSKPLKMKEVTDRMSINKKDLIKMQEDDPTLQKLKQIKGTEIRKGYVVSYEKRGGIWYRIRQRKDDVGGPRKQILVPKSLRERVMGVVHNSLFGGHLGMNKTEDRFQTNFFGQVCKRMLPVSVGLVMFARRLSPEAQCHGHL